MIDTTVAKIASVVGGRVVDTDLTDAMVSSVTSDSRAVSPGSLFVALKGSTADGHDFATAAVAAGAVAILAERPVDAPAIVVDDVLLALGKLARFHLDRLPELTVVAVTGSTGKTTCKDLTAGLLEDLGPTVAPPGSFNNELGLPMTVLSADRDTRFLVLEMGARGRGHIAYLCEVAPPKVGVELMVGTAHVGEFGGRDNIAAAKAELVEALPVSGTAILNVDDAEVMAMSALTQAHTVTFGTSSTADVWAEGVVSDALDRASFRLWTPSGHAQVTMRMPGSHLVPNALAAAAVAHVLGQSIDEIAAGLSRAVARSPWRMEVLETGDGVTVINDSYNASPESVAAALKSLAHMAEGRRSWAVLGEMRELGEESESEHDAIGRLAVRLNVSRLVVVGTGARPIYLGAHLEGSWGEESVFVPDVDAAIEVLRREVRSGDVVLVKASRSIGLDRVAAALLGEPPIDPPQPARRGSGT